MTTTITRKPRSVAVDRTNLVRNPKGTSLTDWSVAAAAGGPALISSSGAVNPSGSNTFVRASPAVDTATVDIRNAAVGANPVTAGTQYTFSAYALVVAGYTASSRIQWLDATGTALSTSSGAAVTPGNAWTRATVTANAPANAVRALLIVRFVATSGNVLTGTLLYLTAAQLETGAAATAYFDGDTVNVPPAALYQWTGSANASPSTQGHYDTADILTTAQLVLPYSMSRPSPNTVTDIPGSDTAVVSLRRAQKRRGGLTFTLDTDAIKAAFEALITQPAAFILTDTDRPAVNMTFALDRAGVGYEIDDETQLVWVAKATVVEQ